MQLDEMGNSNMSVSKEEKESGSKQSYQPEDKGNEVRNDEAGSNSNPNEKILQSNDSTGKISASNANALHSDDSHDSKAESSNGDESKETDASNKNLNENHGGKEVNSGSDSKMSSSVSTKSKTSEIVQQKPPEAADIHVVGMDDSYVIISSEKSKDESGPTEILAADEEKPTTKGSSGNAQEPKPSANSDQKRDAETSLTDDHPSKKSKPNPSVASSNDTSQNSTTASLPEKSENPESSDKISTENAPAAKSAVINQYKDMVDPSLADLIKLEDIPDVVPLESLSLRDIAELESALQIGDKFHHGPDDGWKNDWSGNLQLYEKDVIVNRGYLTSQPKAKPIKIPYYDWVAKNALDSNSLRGLELLFSYIYHMKGTPEMAKKIMAYSLQRPAQTPEQRLEFILGAVRRISYDPMVLHQDGWTTKKASTPDGSLGGAFLIGRKIIWQRYEALVIAFVLDEEFGSLWKAVWVEDLDTFDLEAGELQEAMKKWDNKQLKQNKKKENRIVSSSTRFAANAKFTVEGIEHGIVLAAPTSKGSRGILWPARVRNVVETNLTSSGNLRRNTSKSLVQVVFLAPFWNGQSTSVSNVSDIKDPYSLGPLFEIDTVEASENNIQKYPFDTLSMEQLLGNFKFLGLPKAAFSRYLDSHRIAVSLKTYAKKHLSKNHSHGDDHAVASASLTESHTLAVRTPIFPQVILSLPFDFILSKLPHPSEHASVSADEGDSSNVEPIIDLDSIVRSLSPPECFGKRARPEIQNGCQTPDTNRNALIFSPNPMFSSSPSNVEGTSEIEEAAWSLNNFASDYLVGLFQSQPISDEFSIDGLDYMGKLLSSLVSKLRLLSNELKSDGAKVKENEVKRFLSQCLLIKSHGEETLDCSTLPAGLSKKTITVEWRKACERIYRRAMSKISAEGRGNGITAVVTDTRCNGHITADGSYERPVRIPAAIKGAKMAGAGSSPHVLLISKVEEKYVGLAEDVVIPKAHKTSYVKRLKTKIAAIPADATGVPLTDDSDGEGGEDTVGSRGSYTAATVGVAAALKAVDMVVGGQCVNVFCAIRPPGHHAGRELRPMKAISNGFCLLNPAACAAMYAATPQSEGGLGLRRVCVIDFDVHHGNGTQDVLCSTFDPRFLYVSLHAGGAHINGFEDEDSEDESFRQKLGGNRKDGIFPGRCGDSSPHKGVLNIPLGQKVTSSAVGTALVSQVTPRVEEFSPDLIILSAGFDAHKNDPLGMGGLSAEDFGSLTEVACQMATKSCSSRVISVMEGGYGVPCCRPRDDIFLPNNTEDQLLELGDDLPDSMGDPVPFTLRQKLDKCHAEGFLECVKEHTSALVKCNGKLRK